MRQQVEKPTASVETINVAALEEISEPQNREQIAALAYALWQARGCPDGTPDEDWFQAEQEIVGSKKINEREVECRDYAEEAVAKVPVRPELSQAAHAGASRRG
jgi:hypothetical protein